MLSIFVFVMEKATHLEQLLKLNEELNAFQQQELKENLIAMINHLLLHDFSRLAQILYSVDVDEQKLKELLKNNPQTDAAVIMTDLLIERQKEKIRTKASFKADDKIPGDESW